MGVQALPWFSDEKGGGHVTEGMQKRTCWVVAGPPGPTTPRAQGLDVTLSMKNYFLTRLDRNHTGGRTVISDTYYKPFPPRLAQTHNATHSILKSCRFP